MKIIGIYLNNWVRTGGQRRYLELLDSLAQRGNTVCVVMDEAFEYSLSHAQRVNIPIQHDKRGNKPYSFWYRTHFQHALPAITPLLTGADWVHIHGHLHWWCARIIIQRKIVRHLCFGMRSNAIKRTRIALKAQNTSGFRSIPLHFRNIKYWWYECQIAAQSDLIAFQSTIDEQDYLSRAPRGRNKTVIIPGAIDGPRFTKELAQSNTSTTVRRIIYVGLVDGTKGIDYLLQGFFHAKKHLSHPLKLDIYGRGNRIEQTQQRIRDCNLESEVTLHGQVPNPLSAIAASDLLIYPSLYDAFPDVVLEALHVGTPVIASRIGGIPDILHYDDLLIPIMDARAIEAVILRAVHDPVWYTHLRTLCFQRRSLFLFDWAKAWEDAMLSCRK